MTQRQVSNLATTQLQKIRASSVKLILRKKTVNPVLLRKILFESRNTDVLELVVSYYLHKAREGDVKAKLFINRMCSAKFNKNSALREIILTRLSSPNLTESSFIGLKGLLVGVNDPEAMNRALALKGLCSLAEKGDARVIPGLVAGLKDTSEANAWRGLSGLSLLAHKGKNAKAKKILKELGY